MLLTIAALLGNAAAQDSGFAWEELGVNTWYGNCTSCHQTDGRGIAGSFPPLADHLPRVIARPGGRSYLIEVLLYGLEGEIRVLGDRYEGVMPAWGGTLSDAEIAAVINFGLYAWGNVDRLPDGVTPILPDEVTAARGRDLDAGKVLELRRALGLDGGE